MRRPTWSERLALALVATATATATHAEPPQLAAELSCRPEAAPGRVLCELRFSAPPSARIVWADALVTEAPAFAPPLRARVSPGRFSDAAGTEPKLSLAFVATAPGRGRLAVLARAVVCRGSGERERCRSQTRALSAELRVGS
jgi:hypothetical protein